MRQFSLRSACIVTLFGTAFAIAAACSSFEEEPPTDTTSNEAGVDTGTTDSSVPSDGDVNDVVDAGPITCPSSACEILASGQVGAQEIAADETRVFWTIAIAGTGSVRSVTIVAPGAPKLVSGPVDQPTSLQLFDDVVYYASADAVRQAKKDGTTDGGSDVVVKSGGGAVTSVLRQGTTLFFTYESKLGRCLVANFPCIGTSETAPAGGGAAALASTSGSPPYFAHTNAIWQAGVTNDVTLMFEVQRVRTMLVDSTRLYFLRTGEKSVAALDRSAMRDAGVQALATEATEPRAMAVDGTDLYFTTLETGTITRVSKFGTSPARVVVSGLTAPQGIAVTNDRLFVVDDSRILSMPKPPKTP